MASNVKGRARRRSQGNGKTSRPPFLERLRVVEDRARADERLTDSDKRVVKLLVVAGERDGAVAIRPLDELARELGLAEPAVRRCLVRLATYGYTRYA
jgi:hypothetical protein